MELRETRGRSGVRGFLSSWRSRLLHKGCKPRIEIRGGRNDVTLPAWPNSRDPTTSLRPQRLVPLGTFLRDRGVLGSRACDTIESPTGVGEQARPGAPNSA
ncbi:hypothetical protein Zmor_018422 [Zophobas morio]|uniref:Uncharacterized protein n=1 Tax=Zophobas morio TaxID=2755281 RepID=A0AA38MDU5_9CUCU|nr:hypothetical protein Zmor_018422 [Zophobas morio]